MAGSGRSKDVKTFSHLAGKKQDFLETNHVTGLGSGILSLDTDKIGEHMAFGTQEGQVCLMKTTGFQLED